MFTPHMGENEEEWDHPGYVDVDFDGLHSLCLSSTEVELRTELDRILLHSYGLDHFKNEEKQQYLILCITGMVRWFLEPLYRFFRG